MPCGGHEIVPEQYPGYARSRPVNPLAELHVVFLGNVMTKQVLHPGPATAWKTQYEIWNVHVLIL